MSALDTTPEAWPFGDDADRDDPLTAHRIAVTSSHPAWRYHIAFDRASEERPTEAETRMLASAVEYERDYYRPGWAERMLRYPLDVDGTKNGIVFHKWREGDWSFRRIHWREPGWIPGPPWEGYVERTEGPFTLLQALERAYGLGEWSPPRWERWKALRPGIFTEEPRP